MADCAALGYARRSGERAGPDAPSRWTREVRRGSHSLARRRRVGRARAVQPAFTGRPPDSVGMDKRALIALRDTCRIRSDSAGLATARDIARAPTISETIDVASI